MNYSPEVEERLKKFETAREEKIREIVDLWTRLRKRAGKKAPVDALNKVLDDWFEVSGGLDALDGWAIEKVLNDLRRKVIENSPT